MPPLVCHAWFGAYSLNKKRPRGARSCILAHFQTVKFSFFRQIAHFLIWDFPEMPPLVRHAWFGAYSLKQKRPRGARSCILAHFQRVQLFLYETLSKLLLARSRLYEQLRRRPKSRFSQNNVLYTIHKQKRARSARKTIFPPTRKPGPRAQHTKNTLIVLILLFVKKESSSQSSLHTFFCHVIPSHQRCSYPFQGYQSEWRAKSPAGTCRFRRLMIQTSLLRFTIRSRIKTRNIKKSSCVTDPLLRGGHFWKLSHSP